MKRDYKDIILENLQILHDYEKYNRDIFKTRAYKIVIENILDYYDEINNIEDFSKIKGVGIKIKNKVAELFEKGYIHQVEQIKKDEEFNFKNKLNNIYGIGPAKINELVEKYNIKDIEDLKKHTELLNSKQFIGLKYYEDIQKRIPLLEYKLHRCIFIKEFQKYKGLEYDFVGSYRRNKKTMGDIDILIKQNPIFDIKTFINKLKENNYIIETLALGKNKFMGICKIGNKPARRIDILVSPPNEYYYSLLYFTGSYKFNIGMRRYAKKLGYSLSEHGLKPDTTLMASEKDIFDFLKIPYIEPKNRDNYKF